MATSLHLKTNLQQHPQAVQAAGGIESGMQQPEQTMKTPSIPFAILFLAVLASLQAQDVQVPAPQTAPAELPAATPAEARSAVATPAAMSLELSRLVAFPRGALQYEPALAAALQVTPKQEQELKKAMDDTVGVARKEMVGMDDKKQAYRLLVNAGNEYANLRDTILSDQQVNFLKAIQDALVAVAEQSKSQTEPGTTADVKGLFLRELRPSLNADQVALIEAAGGKLP